MLGFLGQGTLLLIPKRLFGRECTFPVSLERSGDQAVIRVDRFVTTAHERRPVAGALQAQIPLLMKLLTFEVGIIGRLQAHIACRRRQRFKNPRRDTLLVRPRDQTTSAATEKERTLRM